MPEYISVASNTETAQELEHALSIVTEVTGVQSVPGERVYLASDEPPIEFILNLIAAGATFYQAMGGPPLAKILYDKLRERFPGRRVQVLFEMREGMHDGVRYVTFDHTPNEALPRIAYDFQRERSELDPNSMRWWAEGEWKTLAEYQEWLKRK